jgi:hypothetical protein
MAHRHLRRLTLPDVLGASIKLGGGAKMQDIAIGDDVVLALEA